MVGKFNNTPQLAHQKIDFNEISSMSRTSFQAYINRLISQIRLAESNAYTTLDARASEFKYPLETIAYQR